MCCCVVLLLLYCYYYCSRMAIMSGRRLLRGWPCWIVIPRPCRLPIMTAAIVDIWAGWRTCKQPCFPAPNRQLPHALCSKTCFGLPNHSFAYPLLYLVSPAYFALYSWRHCFKACSLALLMYAIIEFTCAVLPVNPRSILIVISDNTRPYDPRSSILNPSSGIRVPTVFTSAVML